MSELLKYPREQLTSCEGLRIGDASQELRRIGDASQKSEGLRKDWGRFSKKVKFQDLGRIWGRSSKFKYFNIGGKDGTIYYDNFGQFRSW